MAFPPCPICDNADAKASKRLEGYKQGSYFDVFFCPECDTAYVGNRVSDDRLYDLIYANAATIAGYNRYQKYYKQVKLEPRPLRYLAGQEDVYWSVWKSVKEGRVRQSDAILEVGCGLGYLTYALRREGYAATGVDISPEAIARAEAFYGPYYQAANVIGLSEQTTERYDVIIMTELIEHLEDPIAFVREVSRLLKPGGHLLITTPNRSYMHGGQQTWQSDLPPVHFWWFSEGSVKYVAKQLSMQSELVDFSGYNRQTGRYRLKLHDHIIQRTPTFDSGGRVLHPATELGPLKQLRLDALSLAKRVLLPILNQQPSKSQTLAFRLINPA